MTATAPTYVTRTVADGLAFPEGPRWHNQRFWFTDQHARRVYAMDLDGRLDVIAETDDLPGGLGWLSDGTLLVVYMTQRRIMRLDAGGLNTYADLSAMAPFHCNDIVVDREDNVYAGNFGFDLHGGADTRPTVLLRITAAGEVGVFADDVVFPNGSVITADHADLLVAETFAHRIRRFRLLDRPPVTGSLWADLGALTPDGVCLDAEGALWVASPGTSELVRFREGGDILARCETSATPYACMLGGRDRKTLFVCSSETDDPALAATRKSGRIEQVEVEIPGDGLP